MELRLVVHHDLNLLAFLVKTITNGSILGGGVFCEWNTRGTSLLHILSTTYQLLNIKASTGNRQQAYRGEYRETTTYVVGDNE